MAPVLELETESEQSLEVSERHRVLIVAAVSAVAGARFRILDIHPLERTRRNQCERSQPYMEEVARAACRRNLLGKEGAEL